jgi:diguanylate cyclase (GGDEF)-like protein
MRLTKYTPVLLAAGIGLALAFWVGVVSVTSEHKVERLRLEDRVASAFSDLDHELSNNFGTLVMLRVFFESSRQPIGRQEFTSISGQIRQFSTGLDLVGWAPRVASADRDAFERSMRDAGLVGFEIRDRPQSGEMIRAPDRPVYYPLLYEAASRGTAFQVIGHDLPDTAERRAAIDKAARTDGPAATPPYLMRQPGKPMGLAAYVPVFRARADMSRGSAMPDGMVFATYRLSPLLDGIVTRQKALAGLDAYVFDPAGKPGQRLAYWRTGDGRARPPPDEADMVRAPHIDASIKLLDQTLSAMVVPVGGMGGTPWTWHVLQPSAFILLLTACIVIYLILSLLRTQQLDSLAENLRDTTMGLQKKAATIAHMARHDALTGLPNRVFFAEALADTIVRGAPCAILQIGLDRFKAVNEFHGHAAGDEVLREVARRLRAITRSGAVVARLGGDAFAVLVETAAAGETERAIGRRLIETVKQPIESGHGSVTLGCSVGVARCPPDGLEVERLLRAADLAMDAAKRKDRGSLCQFEPGMDEEVRSRLALEADLRQAIKAGEIRPYYQPVVRLQDATLVGFEILARWQHARRGMVMPDSFISLAESTGLIGEMTYSLLRRAAKDAAAWPDHLYLALNISPIHLKKTDLADDILSILRQTGFAARRLEVEITESALVSSMDVAKRSLLSLQRAGVGVALDDFGTGYSSLVHLRQLPLNKVKIDRSFVSHSLEDAENGKIVAAIVGLGKSLGIATTAEGIETKDVALSLAALGCDYGQGYFFAAPMTPEAVTKLYGFDRPAKRPEIERSERLQMSGGTTI